MLPAIAVHLEKKQICQKNDEPPNCLCHIVRVTLSRRTHNGIYICRSEAESDRRKTS
jgi:hypothetical protein